MSFDSYQTTGTRNVAVTTDSTGMYFTVNPLSSPSTLGIDASYTDTIHLTQMNYPQNGMAIGSITRTGTGAGSGNIACVLNRSLDVRVICTGQSPFNSSYPYTITFVKEGVHVIGQSDTSGSGSGTTASTLKDPQGATSDGTKLYVAEYNNNRVLIWNTIPTADGTPANIVLGQVNMTSNDNCNHTTASYLCGPWNVVAVGTKIIVSDLGNSRILIWNSIPTTGGVGANIVLGQSDMTSSSTGTSATLMSNQSGVTTDGTRLFVADQWNNRGLIWNTIPTSFTTGTAIPANIVLGEVNMTSSSTNPAPAMYFPMGIATDGTRILIHDCGDNRVLIWNTIPTSFSSGTGIYANIVLGQPDMSTYNSGTSSTSLYSAVSANYVSGVDVHGGKIYVSDQGNNRILIWNTIPTSFTTGTAIPANIVLGQPNFTASSRSGVSSQSLNAPNQTFSDGTRLFITDSSYNRILVFPDPTH